MKLPFSKEQFFAVIADYNAAVWPAQSALTLLAVALVVLVIRRPERAGRLVSFGLAVLWGWVAVAYHLAFFWSINPAAPVFAVLSLAAAAAFAWLGGIRGGLQFRRGLSVTTSLGLLVVLFALAGYPAIGTYIGHRYPASPTFGLPCPTTIFTFGILLMATPGLAKGLVVAPLAWAVIGSTAAFALGVTQDLGLVVVTVSGGYLLLRRASPATASPQARQVDSGLPAHAAGMKPAFFLRLAAWWALILLLAIVNGALREAILVPVLGPVPGLLGSGLLLSLIILLVALAAIPGFGTLAPARYWLIGTLWLLMTLVFEFSFGLLVQQKTLAELLQAYTFTGGNSWPLVLAMTLLAPRLAARLRGIA